MVTMFANPLPPTWIHLHIILYKSKGSRSTSEVSISADVPNYSLKWCWFSKQHFSSGKGMKSKPMFLVECFFWKQIPNLLFSCKHTATSQSSESVFDESSERRHYLFLNFLYSCAFLQLSQFYASICPTNQIIQLQYSICFLIRGKQVSFSFWFLCISFSLS